VRDSRAIPVADGILQTEILVLRHQLNVLCCRSPKRVAVSILDRLVFVWLYRLTPKSLDALKILLSTADRPHAERVPAISLVYGQSIFAKQ
jgi:hypothetical protein